MHAQRVFASVAQAISRFEHVTVCASSAQVSNLVYIREVKILFMNPCTYSF